MSDEATARAAGERTGAHAQQSSGWQRRLDAVLQRVDDFQQRNRLVAVPLAVYKKFSEDEAGKLAALISYYAFLSVFPLLIVLATVLSRVLAGNQELADQIVTTAAGSFLSIGSTGKVEPLPVAGWGLAIGVLITLWSGLAVANTMQDSLNTVYGVAKTERPGFAPRLLRSVSLLLAVGVGLPAATVLQGFVGHWFGALGTTVGLVFVLALNTALITLAFNRATVADTPWRSLLPGAFLAAVAWSVMQAIGTSLLTSRVEGAQQTYGSFALVIGLLFWFFTLAQITLYCAELNDVLENKLWPRSLKSIIAAEAETKADAEAVARAPKREKQAKNMEVAVEVPVPPDSSQPATEAAEAAKPGDGYSSGIKLRPLP